GPKKTSVSASPSGAMVEGSSVTLTCNSKASPPVDTYTWFKNGAKISQSGSWQNFYITNITSEDSGQYYCVATSGHGTGTSGLYTVNVLYSPKNISVSVSPSGDIVEGSSVTLACNSKANPPVDIYTWFKKNGTELSLRGTAQNYIIIDIRPLDSGEYYCEAKNKYGTANSTAVSVNVVYKSKPLLGLFVIGPLVVIQILAFIIYIKRKTSRTPEAENGGTSVSQNHRDCVLIAERSIDNNQKVLEAARVGPGYENQLKDLMNAEISPYLQKFDGNLKDTLSKFLHTIP
ncbi:hypothetical protein Z043_123652, partial [Scleropages formosus]